MRDQGETKIKQPGGLFYRSFSAQSREKRKQICALRAVRLDLGRVASTTRAKSERQAVGSAGVMRAGVLADHVTAVPDVVADGESSGFRLTQSVGVVGRDKGILLMRIPFGMNQLLDLSRFSLQRLVSFYDLSTYRQGKHMFSRFISVFSPDPTYLLLDTFVFKSQSKNMNTFPILMFNKVG